METKKIDNDVIGGPGIDSLRGFSYQIKVFILYLSKIKAGESVEYETLEDVNISKCDPKEFDEKCKGIVSKKSAGRTNYAVQVKRTSISRDSAEKILFNWLLLEDRESVEEYCVFTDAEYENEDIIFDFDVNKKFKKICAADVRADALISKVKNIYGQDETRFITAVESIKKKHKFVSCKNVDEEIIEALSDVFVKDGVEGSIFDLRISELFGYIIKGIFNRVDERRAYTCDYLSFRREVENICERITNEKIILDYASFIKANPLKSQEFIKTREFRQLQYCELSQKVIEIHLQHKEYYHQYKLLNLGNGNGELLDSIEETSSENFEMTKDDLIYKQKDSPRNRLEETKKCPNSYANNEQIKNGALVYLTKDGIDKEKQISWKDEDDE